MTLRQRIYAEVDPAARHKPGLSIANQFVCVLIVLSSTMAVLETEPTLYAGREMLFSTLEIAFAFTFLFEYLVRVWVSAEDPRYPPGLMGRLRYMLTPAAIVDLLALAPVLMAFGVSQVFLLRIFRLVRVLRLARLGRFSSAMKYMGEAVASRRHELILTAAFALVLLMISSTLLYLVEGPAQPQQFGSIPRAMWWSIATLTTVGYGDVYPITVLGRVLASVTALAGIGLIAMPTGILASAFSDALQRQKAAQKEPPGGDG